MNSRKLSIKNLVENTFVAEQGGFSGRSVSDYQTDRGRSRSEFKFTPWDQDSNAIGVSRGGTPRSSGPAVGSPAPQQVPPQVKVAMDDEEQQQSELGRTIDKFQYGVDATSTGLAFVPVSRLATLGRVGQFLNRAKWVAPLISAGVDVYQGVVDGDTSQFIDAVSRGIASRAYKIAPPGSSVVSAADAARHTLPRPLPAPGYLKGKLGVPVNPPHAARIVAAGGKAIGAGRYKISRGVVPLALGAGARELQAYTKAAGLIGSSDSLQTTGATDDSVPGYGPDDARVAPSRRPKKKAPPQRQFEFEGRVWDENLAIGLHQQRRKDAMKRAIETGQPFVEPEPPKPVRIPKA